MQLDVPFSPLSVLHLKTSARNQWIGAVTAMRSGEVNDEVEITLPGGVVLVAVVTRGSSAALGLRTRQTAVAMVKASAVTLSTEAHTASAVERNRIDGVVREILPGDPNDEVSLVSDDGTTVVAVVPRSLRSALAWRRGIASAPSSRPRTSSSRSPAEAYRRRRRTLSTAASAAAGPSAAPIAIATNRYHRFRFGVDATAHRSRRSGLRAGTQGGNHERHVRPGPWRVAYGCGARSRRPEHSASAVTPVHCPTLAGNRPGDDRSRIGLMDAARSLEAFLKRRT
jgi:molybdopterin-binding protein